MQNKTLQKHVDAIRAGFVTRSNIIGIRKALNTYERRQSGYYVSPTSPRVKTDDIVELETAIQSCSPVVIGDMHDTGLTLLRNPRYKNRLAAYADSIAALHSFRLVRFELMDAWQHVPVFQVWANIPPKGDVLDGGTYLAFTFRNIPWQSGGNGPEILEYGL